MERPILFSGPMVRAILDGRKTQTRRVMKTQPHEGAISVHYDRGTGGAMWGSTFHDHGIACPYGKPGDRLWVRETHYCTHRDEAMCRERGQRHYRADLDAQGEEILAVKWTPAIHMPRWASRLTLEITEVRVQRLQEISEEDAIAEGIERPRDGIPICTPKKWFHVLWDSINAKRGYGWSENPWVWAITFKPPAGRE